MTPAVAHTREYLQGRLSEELARAKRYGTPFALVTFEATESAGVSIRRKMKYALDEIAHTLRASDVVSLAFEDTIVVLLVQTTLSDATAALFRMRDRVARENGGWNVATYAFPRDREAIELLPLLTAA